MTILTIDEIRNQTYVSDDLEDDYLLFLGSAAVRYFENKTNRQLFPSSIPMDVDNGLLVSDDIKICLLMLVAYLYENREASSEKEQKPVPFFVKDTMFSYKYIEM